MSVLCCFSNLHFVNSSFLLSSHPCFYFFPPPSHRGSPELSGHQCGDFPNPLLLADWSCNEMYPNIRFSLSCPHLLPLCADISQYPSSVHPPPPTTTTTSLLPRSPSGSLDSVSSHIKQAWRSPWRQGRGTTTSAQGGMEGVLGGGGGGRGGGGGLWPQRGEGRTRHATSRCHQDPNSRLGGRRRDRAMYQRAHPHIPAWGARRQTPLLLTSPHLAARPPLLLPPFDSTIR